MRTASWIDTGVNLLDPRFDIPQVLERAHEQGVNHMLVIASTIDESGQAIALCNSHQHNNHPAVKLNCTAGVHPHYTDQTNPESWTKLKALCADTNVAAIGECGLDFNRNFSSKHNQLYAFEQQLAIASEHGLGVYLHERDAFEEQYALLEKYAEHLKFMVAHCFTGTTEHMNAYLSLGCYIGITGWLCDTKRGESLREASMHLPLSRLLLETDAPYLFPKTLRPRKSTNEPCNIPYIGEYLAELRGEPISLVKQYAFENALGLFFNQE
jgi:TatD DNase family protein